uniref:MULE transposase domain-containing protein n=1 Tax=Plectus sambesii TaxID=2011161 RepID=A0A914V780_9BILA
MDDIVHFIDNFTNKGKPAAIYKGFAYIKDVNLCDGKERFKCIHRSCHGYIWVRDGRALTMLHGKKLGRKHIHKVEPENIEARSRLGTFKSTIKDQPHANIGALVASTRDCAAVVSNAMPRVDLMKRVGRRLKRKKFGRMVRMKVLSDIDMTLERSRITVQGPTGDLTINFLLHDSGIDDADRMLMFGTTNSVASLSRSATIHADGTFKFAPVPFKQVYVLHYEEHARLYPGVVILLPDKTKVLYDRMFSILKSFCQYDMTKIVMDFEYQAIQSFIDVFGVEVEGCFFHFSQAITKNANRLDIFDKIAWSRLKKQHYVMLHALAFLPPGDIPLGFDALTQVISQHNHHSDFSELLMYMEETWVAPLCHSGYPALGKFPPLLWSVHTRMLTNEEHINNKIKGWHNRINNFMEHSHLAFYVFMDELKKFFQVKEDQYRNDQQSALEQEAHYARGEVILATRDNYVIRSVALKLLCKNYQNQLYTTHPRSTGLIRFLSEVADIMTRYD